MINQILFLGPNINKLIDYDRVPTLSEIKNDIITDIFKDIIKDPVLKTEIENKDQISVIKITSEKSLTSVFLNFNKIQQASGIYQLLKIQVEEGDPSAAGPQIDESRVSTLVPATSFTSSTATVATPVKPAAPSVAGKTATPAPKALQLNPNAKPYVSRTETQDTALSGHQYSLFSGSPYTPPASLFSGSQNTQQSQITLTRTVTLLPTPSMGGKSTKAHIQRINIPRLSAQFVKDISFGKESYPVPPNTLFKKTWLIRNDGGLKWPRQIHLNFVEKYSGTPMNESLVHTFFFNEQFQIGGEKEITIALKSPAQPGTYKGFWRLTDESQRKFGHDLEVSIRVEKMPPTEILLKDDLDIQTKKKHLAMLFPDKARNNFAPLLDAFYEESDYVKGTLDDILNGTIKNEHNVSFKMAEIVDRVRMFETQFNSL